MTYQKEIKRWGKETALRKRFKRHNSYGFKRSAVDIELLRRQREYEAKQKAVVTKVVKNTFFDRIKAIFRRPQMKGA